MVWKGTKKFGIGMATVDSTGDTCSYIVARYSPIGNVAGEFRDNIAKSISKTSCDNMAFLNANITKEKLYKSVVTNSQGQN